MSLIKGFILILVMLSFVGCSAFETRHGYVSRLDAKNMECLDRLLDRHVGAKTAAEICKEMYEYRLSPLEGLNTEQIDELDF